ncbi:MAG: hypothetical protein PHT79_06390 [Syntrophomonadaceae bacterium]|nr:hypothetical protein [Syntrophomonadaceae bacterium]MDD3889102.1 hypothetical protein [Syntrophomonadaceae bacterium]MDD4549373.1 hypothetical protein [Syntrophomonadaceae bacterium]
MPWQHYSFSLLQSQSSHIVLTIPVLTVQVMAIVQVIITIRIGATGYHLQDARSYGRAF